MPRTQGRVLVSLPAWLLLCHKSGERAPWAPHTRASCGALGPAGPSPSLLLGRLAHLHAVTQAARQALQGLGLRVCSTVPSAFSASPPCSSGPGGFCLVSQPSRGPSGNPAVAGARVQHSNPSPLSLPRASGSGMLCGERGGGHPPSHSSHTSPCQLRPGSRPAHRLQPVLLQSRARSVTSGRPAPVALGSHHGLHTAALWPGGCCQAGRSQAWPRARWAPPPAGEAGPSVQGQGRDPRVGLSVRTLRPGHAQQVGTWLPARPR